MKQIELRQSAVFVATVNGGQARLIITGTDDEVFIVMPTKVLSDLHKVLGNVVDTE